VKGRGGREREEVMEKEPFRMKEGREDVRDEEGGT